MSTLEGLGLVLQKRSHRLRALRAGGAGAGDAGEEALPLVVEMGATETVMRRPSTQDDGALVVAPAPAPAEAVLQPKPAQPPPSARRCLPPYCYDRGWALGFAVFIVGNVGDFTALGLTQQSTVSLIGGWTLCVNAMLAPWLLNEAFRPRIDAPAILAILAGLAVILAVCEPGNGANRAATGSCAEASRLVRRWRAPVSAAYLACVAAGGVCLTVLARKGVKRSFPFLGAVVASVTIVTAKVASEAIDCALSNDSRRPSSSDGFAIAMLTIVFAMSLPLQIHLINVSLTKNDALYHIPAFFVLWNLLSILSSAAVYEEIRITAESWAILVAGVACLFVGVALVASRGV